MTAVMEAPTSRDKIGDYELEQFWQRMVADCINDGRAWQWRRRADVFDWARPRPTDWPGAATGQQLAEDDRRCAATAAACRSNADLIDGDR